MLQKKTSELQTGLKLAADVCNLDGQILFRKGAEVTPRHIEILQMWGIPTVEVEGGIEAGHAGQIEQFSQLIVEKAEQQVAARMKLVRSSHPAVDVIRSIAVLEAAKDIQQIHPQS